MAQGINGLKQRGIERIFLLLITIVLALLFVKLSTVLQRNFADVPQRLKDGTIVNLNDADPDQHMQALLEKGFYLEDKKDIELIRSVLAQNLKNAAGEIDNIGELNKRKYNVNADQAFVQGGESYKKRVALSRSLLGFTGDDSVRFLQERNSPPQVPSVNTIGLGKYGIEGKIYNRDDNPVAGVLVRLQMLLPQDSLYSNKVSEVDREQTENGIGIKKVYVLDSANNKQLQSLTAYARTDAAGKYAFKNLPDNKAYEILPLQPGYQFGASQGVQQLDGDASFTFYQSPHTIKLLSTKDFNNLKKEKALIVRTPQEFNHGYWILVAVFFISFFLLHLFLSFRFPQADGMILPVIMLLTGLSFITLLSMQDPLRDRFLAKDTLTYFLIGIVPVLCN